MNRIVCMILYHNIEQNRRGYGQIEEKSVEVWGKMDSPDRKLSFLQFLTGSHRIRTLRIGTSSRRKILFSSSISVVKDNNSPCDVWYSIAFNFPFKKTISVLHFLGNVEEITQETRSSLYHYSQHCILWVSIMHLRFKYIFVSWQNNIPFDLCIFSHNVRAYVTFTRIISQFAT